MGFQYPVQLKRDSVPYPGFKYVLNSKEIEILHTGRSLCDAVVFFRFTNTQRMFKMTFDRNGQTCSLYWQNSTEPKFFDADASDFGFHTNIDDCIDADDFTNFELWVTHDVPNEFVMVGSEIGTFITKEYEVIGGDHEILILRKYAFDGMEMAATDEVLMVSQVHGRNLDLMSDLGIVWIGL